jgi:hypothetical protein
MSEISRPDDTGDDDEDTKNLDADTDKMDPATRTGFEGRQALDIGAHLSNPWAKRLKHHSRLALQIDVDLASLRCGFESRLIPLQIDAAAISAEERQKTILRPNCPDALMCIKRYRRLVGYER